MEIAVNTLFLGLSLKIINHKQLVGGFTPKLTHGSSYFSRHFRYDSREFRAWRSHRYFSAVCAILSGAEDVGVSSSRFDDFSQLVRVSVRLELMINVEVFGARTQAIFDTVFHKMVAAVQPIPGFRRVKGGKTPDEGLKVGKDLRVGQSFEDLETTFEVGEKFSFDVVIQLQETD